MRVGIGSVSAVEGDGGTVKMTIRLTLLVARGDQLVDQADREQPVGVVGGRLQAHQAEDHLFKPGNFQKSVVVTLIPNTTAQADRSMQLALSDPVNLTVQGTGVGLGTILDDD